MQVHHQYILLNTSVSITFQNTADRLLYMYVSLSTASERKMTLMVEDTDPLPGETVSGLPIDLHPLLSHHLSVGERKLSWIALPTDSESESTEDEEDLKGEERNEIEFFDFHSKPDNQACRRKTVAYILTSCFFSLCRLPVYLFSKEAQYASDTNPPPFTFS